MTGLLNKKKLPVARAVLPAVKVFFQTADTPAVLAWRRECGVVALGLGFGGERAAVRDTREGEGGESPGQ